MLEDFFVVLWFEEELDVIFMVIIIFYVEDVGFYQLKVIVNFIFLFLFFKSEVVRLVSFYLLGLYRVFFWIIVGGSKIYFKDF